MSYRSKELPIHHLIRLLNRAMSYEREADDVGGCEENLEAIEDEKDS